jgi:hypothetical protein
MSHKLPRPAAREGANRAAGSEFLDRFSNPHFTIVEPEKLAAALERGATLHIGRDETSVSLRGLQALLRDTFRFDDDYRHNRLIVPTAICAHWFWFTGRQHVLNHRYPVTFLHQLITTCFGLNYSDIPMDAVLAGLMHRGCLVERLKAKGLAPFNWAATIRSVTHSPIGGGKLVRITELGKRGAIPPIRISEQG